MIQECPASLLSNCEAEAHGCGMSDAVLVNHPRLRIPQSCEASWSPS